MVRNPQREILAYLMAGGRLTVQKASRLFETTELRKIVSRLRRRGQPIEDVMHYDTTRTGRRVWFNEYRMGHDLGGLQ
jgi:hypothetical protein